MTFAFVYDCIVLVGVVAPVSSCFVMLRAVRPCPLHVYIGYVLRGMVFLTRLRYSEACSSVVLQTGMWSVDDESIGTVWPGLPMIGSGALGVCPFAGLGRASTLSCSRMQPVVNSVLSVSWGS